MYSACFGATAHRLFGVPAFCKETFGPGGFGCRLLASELYAASKAKREAFEALKPGKEDTAVEPLEYLVKLGSVGWPTQMTRPECAFTYTQLCSLSMAPTAEAHEAVMITIGYLAWSQRRMSDRYMADDYGSRSGTFC